MKWYDNEKYNMSEIKWIACERTIVISINDNTGDKLKMKL